MIGLQGANLSAAPQQKAPSQQKVSMLEGKWVFNLPKEYVKNPMPEIDDKARAAGVTGSLYMNKAAQRVVIVTETPLDSPEPVSSNDEATLAGIIAATLEQQQASYQNFKQLGDVKKIVRRGLGLRQLDISGSVDGGKVLSTTVTAASGKRMAMVNVISLEKDAKAHGDLLKGITSGK
nr:polyribonucleotide nucleotidyltransferase [Pseudomonas viridiflava]